MISLRDLAIFLAILAAWFALNRWVLPWLGVPTCMSGACSAGPAAACPNDSLEEPEPLTFSSPYAESASNGEEVGESGKDADRRGN